MGESQDRRKDYNKEKEERFAAEYAERKVASGERDGEGETSFWKAVIYESFPQEAKEIREEVFIREQGFQKEYDEIDHEAAHIVLYDGETAVATCRIFWNEDMGAYTLGRLAVRKEYRGQNIGSLMLREAENLVRRKNGKELILHAQCRAADFYRKSGFAEFGDVGDEEGCPHVWMRKGVSADARGR